MDRKTVMIILTKKIAEQYHVQTTFTNATITIVSLRRTYAMVRTIAVMVPMRALHMHVLLQNLDVQRGNGCVQK